MIDNIKKEMRAVRMAMKGVSPQEIARIFKTKTVQVTKILKRYSVPPHAGKCIKIKLPRPLMRRYRALKKLHDQYQIYISENMEDNNAVR